MRAIVSGGGTGGHIYPALAIADKIVEKYPGSEILYVGTPNSLEERIVAKHGYNFKSIEVKWFQRRISFENVKRIFLASKAIRDAEKIIREFEPDVVIGTGGYVSGPVVYAGSRSKALTIIHEQNAYPGLTNKILSKKVDKIFLGFETARNFFKTKIDIRTVGNPVRYNILHASAKEEARRNVNLPKNKPFILVTGGSGGYDAINNTFVQLIPELVEREIGFIFSTGKRHYEKIMQDYGHYVKADKYMIVDYIDDMPNYIASSDLCIVSAGATTIAEVNAVGRAAIIIPKAYSAENHQEVNAKNIQDNGAGYYIKENDLKPEAMLGLMNEILQNDALREQMERKSKDLYNIDPCETIVTEISKML
ncbi:MAG: undecaprenyldiphospho-muramoylpentapeptide beta-N-acetylglucosaminyltransferase [Peptostreptococcaceae bacterium]|nr:undecaprenyldiphospho-muramoylpentapeptide beta-N-acetylglucosaminyltransferase [Peptostreptococcaceae bacterium]